MAPQRLATRKIVAQEVKNSPAAGELRGCLVAASDGQGFWRLSCGRRYSVSIMLEKFLSVARLEVGHSSLGDDANLGTGERQGKGQSHRVSGCHLSLSCQ